MKKVELAFWNAYLETVSEKPEHPKIEVGIAGNAEIANELLDLYLSGKKTAGSGLVRDYELAGDELPKVGDFWIILDADGEPRCVAKTVRVEINRFDEIPIEVAICEGEGDLSVEYWSRVHRAFFTPFLADWNITDLDSEQVVTEFYEVWIDG